MKQEPLFDLIKSLTGPEKRYFKLFSNRHVIGSKNNYLELFEKIEAIKVYDEKIVKKQVRGSIKESSFAVEKIYLYKLIIKSLNLFYRQNHSTSFYKEQLQSVEILFNKTFYNQALKILEKTKKKAIKDERFKILVEIIDWQIRIQTIVSMNTNTNFDYTELINDKRRFQDYLMNITDYQELKQGLMNETLKLGNLLNKDREERINVILSNKVLKSERVALSQEARLRYNDIMGICYYLLNDWSKCYTHFKNAVNIINSLNSLKEENELQYLNLLNNYVVACGHINNKKEQKEGILEMKNLEQIVKNKDLRTRIFATRSIVEMNYLLTYEHYNEMRVFAEGLEEEFPVYSDKIKGLRKHTLSYNLACIFLYSDQTKKALKWINYILNDPLNTLRLELLTASRILNIIIHYKLGNWELLESVMSALKRSYKKEEITFKIELLFIDFVEAVLKNNLKENVDIQLIILKKGIHPLMSDKYENSVVRLFRFEKWIDHQINNTFFYRD